MNKMRKDFINTEGIIKVSLSGILLILSIIIAAVSKNFFVFLGMFASSVGDISIMASRGVFCNRKYEIFECGIIAFAIAHLMYAIVMFSIGLQLKIVVIIIYILVILILIIALIENVVTKNIISKTMLMILYSFILILNLSMAMCYSWLATIGFLFFIVSDSILAMKEKKERIWQIPIWITYVFAQSCILLSFNS